MAVALPGRRGPRRRLIRSGCRTCPPDRPSRTRGAALDHALIALRVEGYPARVELLPDPHDPELLATIHPGAYRPAAAEDYWRYQTTLRRHTDRGRSHPDERLRRRDFGGGPARRYESDPCLAVLTTTGVSRYDEVRAGQALQHVLLRATASGLTASLYSQPIEVPSTRARLGALCGGGTPQMLLRVGYGLAHSPTERRPVPEVLVPDRDD